MDNLKKYDVDLREDPDIYNLPVFVNTPGLKLAFIAVFYQRGQPDDHVLVSQKFLNFDITSLSPKQKSILLKMFMQLNPPTPDDQTKRLWTAVVQKKMSELRKSLYGQDTQPPGVEMGALGGRKRQRSRSKSKSLRSLVAKTRSKRQRSKRSRSSRAGGKK